MRITSLIKYNADKMYKTILVSICITEIEVSKKTSE